MLTIRCPHSDYKKGTCQPGMCQLILTLFYGLVKSNFTSSFFLSVSSLQYNIDLHKPFTGDCKTWNFVHSCLFVLIDLITTWDHSYIHCAIFYRRCLLLDQSLTRERVYRLPFLHNGSNCNIPKTHHQCN